MQTINRVEVFPVGLPIKKAFTFSSGSAGDVGELASHVYVKVTDSDGAYGWGESRTVPGWSYETQETVVSTLERYLAPALLGMDVFDHRGHHQRMDAVIGRGPSKGQPIAKSALDIAIYDLASRSQGLPLRSYLGGDSQHRTMEFSWTCTAKTATEMVDDVESGRALGMRHFNFKPGLNFEADIAVAEAIKATAPSNAFVWADANQGCTLPEALKRCRVFEQIGVDVFEQPLAADQMQLMQQLRGKTTLPLAVDESTVGPADFFHYAARGLVDYLVLKVTRTGGLWPSVQQLNIMEAAGLEFLVSGLTDGMLTKMAASQLAATYGCKRPLALNGSQFTDDTEIFPDKAPFESDGELHLGDASGIGIDPDEAAIKRLKVDL